MRQVSGLFNVLSKDSCSKAISAIVSSLGHFLQSLELLNGQNGAEDLLAANLHVIGHIGENSGLENGVLVFPAT